VEEPKEPTPVAGVRGVGRRGVGRFLFSVTEEGTDRTQFDHAPSVPH
jgi:hypothetical protein